MGTMETSNDLHKLREKLVRTGLVLSEFSYWNGIVYLWAEARYRAQTFAKYVFTYSDYEQWKNQLYDNDDFSEEIIEPQYFSLADDLSWNLYWISLLEQEEYEKVLLQERSEHESNTEFTRNFVFSTKEICERIPVCLVKAGTMENFDTPEEDWLEILKEDGNEFCLKEFSNCTWNQFVQSGIKQRNQYPLTQTHIRTTCEKILKLNRINMPMSFRPHCYPKDWKADLADVNLLNGSNGSGKTSVLHAIELAMTGEISQKKAAEPNVDKAFVTLSATVEGRDQIKTIYRPSDTSEKKDRERLWYMNRASSNNRTGDKLNEVFHRYNFVSVEDPFLFTKGQPDYQKVFATLLYGPETDNQWNNIKRYLDNCIKKVKDLDDDLTETKQELEAINRTGVNQIHDWKQYLPHSAIFYTEGDSLKTLTNRTAMILTAYSRISADEPVGSLNETEQQLKDTKERLMKAANEAERVKADYQALELRFRGAENQSKIYKQNLTNLENLFNHLKPVAELQGDLKFLASHQQEVASYQTLLNKKAALTPEYEKLTVYYEKYKDLGEATMYLPQDEIQNQINRNQERCSLLDSQLKIVKKEAEELEAANSQYQQAQALFCSSSEALLALRQEIHECPMCGTQNITKEMILYHLSHGKKAADEKLQECYTRCSQLVRELEAEMQRSGKLQEQLVQSIRIQEAADKAGDAGFTDSGEPLNRIRQAISKRHEMIRDFENIEHEIKKQKKILTVLYQSASGNTEFEDIDSVLSAPERAKKIFAEINYTPPSSYNTVELQSYVAEILLLLDGKKRDAEAKLNEYIAILNSIPMKEAGENRDKIFREHSELETEFARLQRIQQFWEQISPHLRHTDVSGKAIEKQCLQLNQLLSVEETLQKIRDNEHQLKERQQRITKQLARCKEFEKQLKKLQEPQNYALRFIQNNISEISELFLSLHAPREFHRLGLNDAHCLVGYRGDEEVPLQQMSTGQKTAVVLAVFFRMHLTNPAAPGFLLLDEPVSNTDDLNVLSLLDLLRELAISHHTQIFMTTANRNIAKLFRRKFSFLGHDFQELSFKREKDLQTAVIRRIYNRKTVESEERVL